MNLNQIKKTLVLDIETASMVDSFENLSIRTKSFWTKKCQNLKAFQTEDLNESSASLLYQKKAAIYSEFSKVICISVGIFEVDDEIKSLRVKSFYGDDENSILQSFASLLNDHFYDKYHHTISGHNLKEFDIPFLCRRMIINNIRLPNLLRIHGAKPWQVPHLVDTLELWKFGDYKNYSSLDLLCHILNIPTPKDQMNGSDVSQMYWNGGIHAIKEYCEKDIVATSRILLKLLGSLHLDDDMVTFIATEPLSDSE